MNNIQETFGDYFNKMYKKDGYLDKYEEHIIRKISDLIHISHSDYINIKLEIREA